ncbi:MAG: EAL domain-containing protein, partial [Acidobacteriota bacterium]
SPADGSDAATLLKNASAALSHARKLGGGNYQFYSSQINMIALKRVELEGNLRHALERKELEVFYQPKVDFSSGRIVGMESLLRWERSDLGSVPPMHFISVAEEIGAIIPISEWVLEASCCHAKEWRDHGFDLQVAVNLSPLQFHQPDLVKRILDVLKRTGLNPNFLNLEVTEGSIFDNADSAIGALRELRDAGVSISIDDFGTGYSSLGYLKDLPIDVLKIDKSFVKDVTENPDDAALVMAIMTLAHNLNLKVVAEGVETEEQLRFLRLLKCDEWQGYLCSKALPAPLFGSLLEMYTGIPAWGSKTPLVSKQVPN